LKILKAGVFILIPQVIYVDKLGNTKTSKLQSITVTANPPIPKEKTVGKISLGTSEIDQLLLGGIPEHYAVVLTGSPSDEREIIIKNFLEEGTKEDQITFFVSTEAIGLKNLLDDPNFYLFLCNPKPKSKVPDLPNVYKLRSKTDLTNLSISLAKAFRKIEASKNKRVCIEIVSDVLLEYGAKATRKWISELTTDLSSKGFTIFAVIDLSIHTSEQANAVINLFDGEIELAQTGDPLECKKSIRVKKLRNKDFNKNPICLTKTT
jgi:KaiC/GvpD/RAD55 family RecA-like ATPase